MNPPPVAVIGGGWAGLAAATTLLQSGRGVTLYEMAGRLGGRARSIGDGDDALDNGQHILIGAYTATLALMRDVGADPDRWLARMPLTLRHPDGRGLRLRGGPAVPAFVRAVATGDGWSLRERALLLAAAAGWAARRFRCDPALTVAALCVRLPARIRADLIDPLCVAALNTPAEEASASVFLRVLRDALFSGAGAADLLLPRAPLDRLLPEPAGQWLERTGAQLRLGHRVGAIERADAAWCVDGHRHSAVVLACSAAEAARLVEPIAPVWARSARALRYEPIITVVLDAPGCRLPYPMVALTSGPSAPAQFVFDHGALGGRPGRLVCAISGAAAWVAAGLAPTGETACEQVRMAFGGAFWPVPPRVERVLAEKRATFRCTPQLDRPAAVIADRLYAAGDFVAGPYPATLEGAVRSGRAAAALAGH